MKKTAWVVTITAVLAGTSIAIIQNKVLPCITLLQEVFDISASTAGWLSSVFSATGIVIAIPGAMIVSRMGVKRAGLFSMICALAGSLLGVFAASAGLLMISRIIEGVGLGLISIAVPSIISMWFPPEKRGLPMGVWSSWQFVAQAVVFFFGYSITDTFGWKGIWWFGIIIAFTVTICYAAFVKAPPTEYNHAEIETEEKVSIRSALSYRPVWYACIAGFCFNFACFGFVSWVAPSWAGRFEIELDVANKFISFMQIWALPVVIAVGVALDRARSKIKFCMCAFVAYVPIVSAAFLLPGAKWIIPFVIVYPIAEGAVITGLWTILPQTVDECKCIPIAIGMFGLTQNIGMLLGPPIVGAMAESGGWHFAAIPLLIVTITGGLMTSRIQLYEEGEEKQLTA